MAFIQGDITDALKDIHTPVHCVICINLDILQWVNLVPLHPEGSLWVYANPRRRLDGSLPIEVEKLVVSLDNWFLADKVHWTPKVEMKSGTLFGYKDSRKYTGSCGSWFRFTKSPPKFCWCQSIAHNVLERSSTKDASWYEPFINMTCPEDGIVLDPFCEDILIAQAASNCKRQFIGICKDVESMKNYIDNNSQKDYNGGLWEFTKR